MSSESTTQLPWYRHSLPWKGLLGAALLPVLAFGFFAVLGGRGSVEVLSQLKPMSAGETMVGLLYLFCYAAMTMLSPVFAIAAGLVAVWNWAFAAKD